MPVWRPDPPRWGRGQPPVEAARYSGAGAAAQAGYIGVCLQVWDNPGV